MTAALGVVVCALTIAGQTAAPISTTTASASQTPAPEKPQRRPSTRRPPLPPARVTVVPNQTQLGFQVVTVVHRLTGVKLLRLLQRQSGETFTIENIDPLTLMADAHASILAGWALEDGKTIAARLPQASAELEMSEPWELRAGTQGRRPADPASAFMMTRSRIEPDLTVITGTGQKLRAHLIGLDGETGLSILQVMGKLPSPSPLKPNELSTGQGIQIFAPEPVSNEVEALPNTTYVKVGIVDVTLAAVSPEKSTTPDKLIVHGVKFSPAIVGGVACDRFGNTLGIVESIDGNSASIVPASAVQAASRRVLARQASVPRPWLGVRGESIELAGSAGLLAQGWRADQVKELMNDQIGILLTTVTPKTPAAVAKLQPGDIIVSVNQKDVKGADGFSDLLGKAGSGEQVQFTIRRPAAPSPFDVPVTLGSSFAPAFEWSVFAPTPFLGLERWGIQTLGLGFAARNGLIVVAVQPESAAARSGLREGDVIESIDGHAIGRSAGTMAFARQKKHTVWIVRDREKKQIVLEVEE
jgi:S1-C subfamily serine protease